MQLSRAYLTRALGENNFLKEKLSSIYKIIELPLLEIIYLNKIIPQINSDYIFITSKHAINFPNINQYKEKNFICVGDATMRYLQNAGFKNVIYGGEDAKKLSDYLLNFSYENNIKNFSYLRAEEISMDFKEIFLFNNLFLEEYITYKTEAINYTLFPKFQQNDIITILSNKTAKFFIRQIKLHNKFREAEYLTFFVFSDLIKDTLQKDNFLNIIVTKPNLEDMVKKIGRYKNGR